MTLQINSKINQRKKKNASFVFPSFCHPSSTRCILIVSTRMTASKFVKSCILGYPILAPPLPHRHPPRHVVPAQTKSNPTHHPNQSCQSDLTTLNNTPTTRNNASLSSSVPPVTNPPMYTDPYAPLHVIKRISVPTTYQHYLTSLTQHLTLPPYSSPLLQRSYLSNSNLSHPSALQHFAHLSSLILLPLLNLSVNLA